MLSLAGNVFAGNVSFLVDACVELRVLELQGCQLEGPVLLGLSFGSSLRELRMEGNFLNSADGAFGEFLPGVAEHRHLRCVEPSCCCRSCRSCRFCSGCCRSDGCLYCHCPRYSSCRSAAPPPLRLACPPACAGPCLWAPTVFRAFCP